MTLQHHMFFLKVCNVCIFVILYSTVDLALCLETISLLLLYFILNSNSHIRSLIFLNSLLLRRCFYDFQRKLTLQVMNYLKRCIYDTILGKINRKYYYFTLVKNKQLTFFVGSISNYLKISMTMEGTPSPLSILERSKF